MPADENDPAAPLDGEIADGLSQAAAMLSANGDPQAELFGFAAPGAAPQQIPIDIAAALQFLESCTTSDPRVTYGLGAKVPSDDAPPGAPIPPGFLKVDCSGFVRATIRRATNPKLIAFPDGSIMQHDWVRSQGYPATSVESGALDDGKVRIAFLPPAATKSKIGHVVLLYGGQTLESHGGVGPDQRDWDTLPWRIHTIVYSLTW